VETKGKTITPNKIEENDLSVVLIVDNLDSNKSLSNSKEIRKEITKSENLRNKVKLAYKLPLGGIAVHFKSKKEKEDFKKREIIEEFGKDTFWHEPKILQTKIETVGFAKNIQTKDNLESIKEKIETQTNTSIKNITRLRYWDTKKLMPVVKIEFENPEDLEKAVKTEIIVTSDGKKNWS